MILQSLWVVIWQVFTIKNVNSYGSKTAEIIKIYITHHHIAEMSM